MRRALRIAAAQLLVAAVTFAALAAHANAATAGFGYLLAILGIAVSADLAAALAGSVTATACYNYYFFPPVRTFTIQEPANWVALFTFFIASIVASRLVLRARTQAETAEQRRNEIEALYRLSVDLFTATNRLDGLGDATSRALANVGATGGGLVLFGNSPYEQHVVSWLGDREDLMEELIAVVGRHKATVELPARSGREVLLPLKLGTTLIGVLVVRNTAATVSALESAATLVALAVERERFLAESARMQAIREGDALKTSLLRAVSHDLNTPLTAIALQVERLRKLVEGSGRSDDGAGAAVASIAEDTGRLQRRIENLLAMARLEARSVVPRPEPAPAADLFRAAREHLPLLADSRPIEVRVAADCPDAFVDPSLALEILVNLIENAHQASPAGSVLELSARRHPLDPERVRLEVADRGSGIATPDPSDTPRQGLGLEIARSLGTASGGEVTLCNRPGGGTVARIDLPAAQLPAFAEELQA